jgi:hypothetical protein
VIGKQRQLLRQIDFVHANPKKPRLDLCQILLAKPD